jgi:hypothetical protein
MHYAEKVSKGTGVQAALLAPNHVRLHRLRRGNVDSHRLYAPPQTLGAGACTALQVDGPSR